MTESELLALERALLNPPEPAPIELPRGQAETAKFVPSEEHIREECRKIREEEILIGRYTEKTRRVGWSKEEHLEVTEIRLADMGLTATPTR